MPGLALIIIIVATIFFLGLRSARVEGHRIALSQEIADPAGRREIGAAATVTALDAIYHMSRIDLLVLDAIDRAHGRLAFDSYGELVDHVDNVFGKGDASVAGAISQYKGYLGENVLAQRLRQQGHEVELASEPNQEGWDAIVDGEKVQFKAGTDPAAISEHLDQNPDIPVITVSDHANYFEHDASVTVMERVSGESIEHSTKATLEGIDGMADAGFCFPVVTLVMSSARHVALVGKGHTDLRTAAKNTMLDTAGVGIGGMAGAKIAMIVICGVVGLSLGPLGLLVGVVVGGIIGAALGKKTAQFIKEKDLRAARERLSYSLLAFPEAYSGALKKKADALQKRAREIRPRGLRRVLWPSFGDEARKAVNKKIHARINRCHDWADLVSGQFAKAKTQDEKVKIADFYYCSNRRETAFSSRLQLVQKAIIQARDNVRSEERKLGIGVR